MAYVVPAMPLLYSIWLDYDPAVSLYGSPDGVDLPCNLSPGKRTFTIATGLIQYEFGIQCYVFPMELLVEKLAYIGLYTSASPHPCIIECPQASGRLYLTNYVDDIAKGFANEHRLVMMLRVAQTIVFADVNVAVPIPLT